VFDDGGRTGVADAVERGISAGAFSGALVAAATSFFACLSSSA